jgi:hypothetical protein
VIRHALPRTAVTSLRAQDMREQRNHEQDDEKEEQQLGDARGGHGNPCESEECGYQSHNKKPNA